MKICEIESRIYELESIINQLYKELYRDILNKIENVLYFHKEYTEYENSLYEWIKSFREVGQNSKLISYRLSMGYNKAVNSNFDIVTLNYYTDNYWDNKTISIPTSLVKFIIDEFNK